MISSKMGTLYWLWIVAKICIKILVWYRAHIGPSVIQALSLMKLTAHKVSAEYELF